MDSGLTLVADSSLGLMVVKLKTLMASPKESTVSYCPCISFCASTHFAGSESINREICRIHLQKCIRAVFFIVKYWRVLVTVFDPLDFLDCFKAAV